MLHLRRTKHQNNISHNKIKKSFTMIEIITAITVASIIVLITFQVLSQCLSTLNDSTTIGSMDNAAYNIHVLINKELAGAKDVDIPNTKSHFITKDSKVVYQNLYYTNSDNYSYAIICTPNKKGNNIDIVYSPLTKESQVIKNIFDSSNSNRVKVTEFKFFIDSYDINNLDKIKLNSDFYSSPSRLIKYQFTLENSKPDGIVNTKTYFFEEGLICRN